MEEKILFFYLYMRWKDVGGILIFIAKNFTYFKLTQKSHLFIVKFQWKA